MTIFVPPPPIPLCVPHPDVCTQEMEEVKKGGGVRIKRERERKNTLEIIIQELTITLPHSAPKNRFISEILNKLSVL